MTSPEGVNLDIAISLHLHQVTIFVGAHNHIFQNQFTLRSQLQDLQIAIHDLEAIQGQRSCAIIFDQDIPAAVHLGRYGIGAGFQFQGAVGFEIQVICLEQIVFGVAKDTAHNQGHIPWRQDRILCGVGGDVAVIVERNRAIRRAQQVELQVGGVI